jgi:predicted ArsR family transcriptional regulator
MAQGLVEREVYRAGRGRPGHRYRLTERARRQAGNNFGDLALVLWNEIRGIKDPEVRRGLLERLARSLASLYAQRMTGETPTDRLSELRELFSDRRVGLEVKTNPTGPALTVVDCPYPDLAEHDRAICAMEKMLFAQLLDTNVHLSQCRLDGHNCCEFQVN